MDEPQLSPTPQPKQRVFTVRTLFLPIVIIVAGFIVATAIYSVRIGAHVNKGSQAPEVVRPVSPEDHIIGNPSAPIVLVEYADIDSEYSKKLQLIMEQLMTEYASGNKVAWVYRHFPVTTLHPKKANSGHSSSDTGSPPLRVTNFRSVRGSIDSLRKAMWPSQNTTWAPPG